MTLVTKSDGASCTALELFHESRKVGRAQLTPKISNALQRGDKRTVLRGRGMEFYESRPYVSGDEIRFIDWRVTARLNKIHTKVFALERGRPVYFVVDQRSSMFFGSVNCFKVVQAAKITARLAHAAINGYDQIGGMVFDEEREVETMLGNHKALARLFGMLAQGSQTKKPSSAKRPVWSIILQRLYNRLHPGSLVFLLSDFSDFSPELGPVLSKLKHKADIMALPIADPLEESWPSLGMVGMTFLGESITFDSNDKELKSRYQAARQQQKIQLEAMFSKYHIPILSFMTSDDLDVALRKLLVSRR